MKKLQRFLLANVKGKRKFALLPIGLTMTAGAWGALFYFGLVKANDPDPKQFPIRGIDISSHQNQIDWAKLDVREVNFILIKATEGGDFKDPMFQSNWQSAKQKGAVIGAYHFFTFCKPGKVQAKNYIDSVPRSENALPPVIDLEFSGNCQARLAPAALEQELNDFIAEVDRFYGKRSILYVTYEFYDQYLQGKYRQNPIWISDFYSFYKLPTLSDQRAWSFWQYSERGRISGISTLVDLNVFAGNRAQFEQLVNPANPIPRP